MVTCVCVCIWFCILLFGGEYDTGSVNIPPPPSSSATASGLSAVAEAVAEPVAVGEKEEDVLFLQLLGADRLSNRGAPDYSTL